MFKLLHVLRTLEHHVFEQVSETGAAFGLHAKADVVIDGNGDDWRNMIFGYDYLEAIRKLVVDERNVDWLWRRNCSGERWSNTRALSAIAMSAACSFGRRIVGTSLEMTLKQCELKTQKRRAVAPTLSRLLRRWLYESFCGPRKIS
jgi:hypothetical protein